MNDNSDFDTILGAANPALADEPTELSSGKGIMMVSEPMGDETRAAEGLVEAALIDGYLFGYVDMNNYRVIVFYRDSNPDTVLQARGMKRVIFIEAPKAVG